MVGDDLFCSGIHPEVTYNRDIGAGCGGTNPLAAGNRNPGERNVW